jgi:hypothetical protein
VEGSGTAGSAVPCRSVTRRAAGPLTLENSMRRVLRVGLKALEEAEKEVRVMKLEDGLPGQEPPVEASTVVLRLMVAQLSAPIRPERLAVEMSKGVMSKVCSRT